MIAEQLSFDDLSHELPLVVLWCEEQKDFTVVPVTDWVGDKMKTLALVNEVHLHPVGVFKTAEAAFSFVQLQQKKDLDLVEH